MLNNFDGLHKFMNWNKPILTDSGYQIMSLSKLNKIDLKIGAIFQSHIDGKNNFKSRKKYSSSKIHKFWHYYGFRWVPKLTKNKKILSKAIDVSTNWAKEAKLSLKR